MNSRNIFYLFIVFMCGFSPVLSYATDASNSLTIVYQGNPFDMRDRLQALQFRQQLKNKSGLLEQLENFINTPLGRINNPATLNTIKHLLSNIQTAPELKARLNQAEQAHSALRQHLKKLKEQQHSDDSTQQMLSSAYQHLTNRAFDRFHHTLTTFANRLKQQPEPHLQAQAELSYLHALEYASRFIYKQAINHMSDAVENTTESRYWRQYGIYLNKVGNYESAIYAFGKALTLNQNYPNVAHLYTHIGQAYEASKNFQQATNNYAKALTININTLSESHPQVARDYSNLASALKNKGEYDQAIEAYKKALNIDLALFGLENTRVAAHYNNLGTVWSLKNNPDFAINYYNKALNIHINIDGHEHIRVANRYYNIGLAWAIKGDTSYATLHFTKALIIYLSSYGKNHPNVARLYNSLGNAAYSQGHHDNAINYFTESLEISLQTIKKDAPLIAQQYNNLGVVWKAKGNIDFAIEYYIKALMSSLNAKRTNKTDLAAHYNNLGNAWTKKGNNEQALANYQKSLALLIQKFGDKHPSITRVENQLKLAQARQNKKISVVANNSP